jgi:PBP1b-binding outer membrane lipoprotein LpoB
MKTLFYVSIVFVIFFLSGCSKKEEDKAKGLAKVVVKGGRFKLKY